MLDSLARDEHKYPPLQRQDLDAVECENPLCPTEHPVFIGAHCHPNAGLIVEYEKETGCLNLFCVECTTFVTRVSVEEATIQ